MAIDPTISLGVQTPKTPDINQWAQLANLGMQNQAMQQQISASQTAQQAQQAQIPGIQAESDIKKRAADFNQWITDNKSTYTNEDGTPNIQKFVNGASSAGYFKEAQATAAADLANQATAVANSANAQDKALKMVNFTQNAQGHIATLLDAAPEAQRPALLQQYSTFLNKTIPGSGDQVTQALSGPPDPNTGATTIDPAKIAAVKKATMTPLEGSNLAIAQGQLGVSQGQLGVSQEGMAQSGAANITSPDARKPDSVVSANMRTWARNAGINGVTDNMSAADITHLPGYSGAISNAVVPASAKAAATQEAVGNLQLSNKYGVAATAVDRLISRGILDSGTNLSSWMEQNASKFQNDPDVRNLQAQLNDITAANPAVNLNVGSSALSAQLKTLQGAALKNSNTASTVANSNTFNQAQPAAVQQSKQPVQGQPQPITRTQTAPTANPSGQTITMSHVNDYAARNHMAPADVIKMLQSKGIKVIQ